jgi:hypothetical protein
MAKETIVTCDWCERPVEGEVATMVVRGPKSQLLKMADLCLQCVESLPGAQAPVRRRRATHEVKSKRTSPTGKQIAYAEKLANQVGDAFEVTVRINGDAVDFEAISAYIGRLAPPSPS